MNKVREILLFLFYLEIECVIMINIIGVDKVDKSKEKGQALIEFVLLLPIIIFLIFIVIDIGRIIYTKTYLESKMNHAVSLISDGTYNTTKLEESLNDNNDQIIVKLKTNTDTEEIILTKQITFITPGFNKILDNPYNIKIKRIIAND